MSLENVIKTSKITFLETPPQIEIPDTTLYSTEGYLELLPHMIGRHYINDNFKGVGLEGNIDELIKIAKDKNMELNDILHGVSKEAYILITKKIKRDIFSMRKKKRDYSINYITNKDSLRIFENIKAGLNLENEDFFKLGETMAQNNKQIKAFLRANDFDIETSADKAKIINELKNKTKAIESSTISINTNSHNTKTTITSTPSNGVLQPDYIAYWGGGIQTGIAKGCKGNKNFESEFEIDKFTKKFKVTFKYHKSKEKKSINRINSKFRQILNNTLAKLKEETSGTEKERKYLNDKVKDKTAIVKAVMYQMKDTETFEHQIRMAYVGLLLLKQAGASNKDIMDAAMSYPIHDNQKNIIPDLILQSPDDLTQDQRELIKTHAAAGVYKLLEIGFPIEQAMICSFHQGRANGSEGKGYGELIPIIDNNGKTIGLRAPTWKETSIIGITSQLTDAYDAMRSKRTYKDGMTNKIIKMRLEKDGENGILESNFTNFFVNNTIPVFEKEKYLPEDFVGESYNFKNLGSIREKEMIGYIKGDNQKYRIRGIPEGLTFLLRNHKIKYPSKEELIHNVGNSLRKSYFTIQDPEYRQSLKNGLPGAMRLYLN